MLWLIIWLPCATRRNFSLCIFSLLHSAVVFSYKMAWFITKHTLFSFDAVTQKHSLNRGSFVSMETNNTVINHRAKSKTENYLQQEKTQSGSTADYGHHKTRWFRVNPGNRSLHRWCLLCGEPGGSWAVPPRWDHRALSCHPHPSQRWGAWDGWYPLSCC